MKKYVVLLVLTLAVAAFGHSASEVDLIFDTESKILTIEAKHSVKDAEDHYIDEIVVELNGEEIITQVFKKQTNNDAQIVSYVIIDAEEGDEIEVITNCSKFGKEKASIVIGEVEDEEE